LKAAFSVKELDGGNGRAINLEQVLLKAAFLLKENNSGNARVRGNRQSESLLFGKGLL
jgi:hypothetical protein